VRLRFSHRLCPLASAHTGQAEESESKRFFHTLRRHMAQHTTGRHVLLFSLSHAPPKKHNNKNNTQSDRLPASIFFFQITTKTKLSEDEKECQHWNDNSDAMCTGFSHRLVLLTVSLFLLFSAQPPGRCRTKEEKKEGRRKAADKVSPTCNVIWHMAPLRCLSSEYGRSLTFLFVYWILSAPAFLYAPVDLPRPIIMVRTAWTTLILVTSSYAHAVRHDDPATTTSSSSASSTPRSGLRSMP